MEKIDKLKVTEHNDLIKSTIKMDLIPLKLFEMAAAAVNPRKSPKENQVIKLKKKNIFKLLGVKGNDRNRALTRSLRKLRDQASFELTTIDERGNPVEIGIKPVVATKNPSAGEYVEVEFYHDIMPYLTELKRDFTRYDLIDVAQMSSRYGISLYKILVAYYNQYEIYSKRKLRTQSQLQEFSDPSLSLSELRKWTGTTKKYTRFQDYDRNVIQNAIKDINKHSSLEVKYDKLRWGRKVIGIQFHIRRKDKQVSATTVGINDITTILCDRAGALLLGNGLVDVKSLQRDPKLNKTIQTELIPAYHRFATEYNYQELGKHLSYVASKLKSKPKYLVRYLMKALASYEEQLIKVRKQRTEKRKGTEHKKYRKNSRPAIQEPKPEWLTNPQKPKMASEKAVNALKERLEKRKTE